MESPEAILSDPRWVAVIFAGLAFVILAITNGRNLIEWISRRRYEPQFEGPWAEGTILRQFDPTSGRSVSQTPCVYLTITIKPGGRSIHRCEVWFGGRKWLAHFDTAGYDRYDVLRDEHLHIGRFEVDLETGKVTFNRPVHIAAALQRAGGWIGEPFELKSGDLTVEVDGEVDGKPLHKAATIRLDLVSLLKNVHWQEAWRVTAPDLVEGGIKAIGVYVNTLEESSTNS